MKPDITTESDIRNLVDTFYNKVNEDPILSPVFNEVATVNWPTHLPIMYRFWSSLLLSSKSYSGQPFPKHLVLPIQREHFERWLSLFHATLDELFFGTVADHAKYRASTIATIFQSKLGLLDSTQLQVGSST